jgi:sulfoxide reductase heme-binding subunit YedZ
VASRAGRLRTRIVRHHLPLLIASAAATGVAYAAIESPDGIFKWSLASAYPAMALLAATLITGPLHVLRRRTSPLSDDLTRDLGIWAGATTLLHVVFGLQVHMRGRMWLLFVPENAAFPYIRFDEFGAANYTGAIATIILLLLLATSNDWALRSLGPVRWKRVQRWNYGLFGLTCLHGLLYQDLENKAFFYSVVLAVLGTATLLAQLSGIIARRRQPSGPSPDVAPR